MQWHNPAVARRISSPRSTLRSVVDQLGGLVLGHTASLHQLERPVTGVVIADAEHGAPLSAGCVVLGVGADRTRIDALVAEAAAVDAAAVVVKRSPGSSPSTGGAVPVVEVAPDLAWEQLHVFIRTALLQGGAGRPGGPRTLFDVANAVAVRADGAVVIEDEHLRVVAYSSLDHPIDDARRATIIGRQIPDQYVAEIRQAGITTHLEGSPDPVRVDLADPGMLPRLAIALRSGGRTIGLMWTITDDEREAEARRVLADAAPDVAGELLRHVTADASLATDRFYAAQQLLDGRSLPNLRELLAVERAAGYVALAIEPAGPGTMTPGDADPVERTAQFATVYVDAYRIPALVAPAPVGRVEVVVVLGGATDERRARRLLDELCSRVEATFGFPVLGAMGAVVEDARGIPGSRGDASAVLEVLGADRAARTTASYEEVQSRVALRELLRNVEASEHLGRGPVPGLLSSQSKMDTAVVATVRAVLAHGGDVGRTAAALGVHRNTIRYRIGRFEELTGLDLSDQTDRLVVELQLLVATS